MATRPSWSGSASPQRWVPRPARPFPPRAGARCPGEPPGAGSSPHHCRFRSWGSRRGDPDPKEPGRRCRPGRGRLQLEQTPRHGVSQQMPSTQLPDWQAPRPPQLAPLPWGTIGPRSGGAASGIRVSAAASGSTTGTSAPASGGGAETRVTASAWAVRPRPSSATTVSRYRPGRSGTNAGARVSASESRTMLPGGRLRPVRKGEAVVVLVAGGHLGAQRVHPGSLRCTPAGSAAPPGQARRGWMRPEGRFAAGLARPATGPVAVDVLARARSSRCAAALLGEHLDSRAGNRLLRQASMSRRSANSGPPSLPSRT